jgi:hypothetical protein
MRSHLSRDKLVSLHSLKPLVSSPSALCNRFRARSRCGLPLSTQSPTPLSQPTPSRPTSSPVSTNSTLRASWARASRFVDPVPCELNCLIVLPRLASSTPVPITPTHTSAAASVPATRLLVAMTSSVTVCTNQPVLVPCVDGIYKAYNGSNTPVPDNGAIRLSSSLSPSANKPQTRLTSALVTARTWLESSARIQETRSISLALRTRYIRFMTG